MAHPWHTPTRNAARRSVGRRFGRGFASSDIAVPVVRHLLRCAPSDVAVPVVRHLLRCAPSDVAVPVVRHLLRCAPSDVEVPVVRHLLRCAPSDVAVPVVQHLYSAALRQMSKCLLFDIYSAALRQMSKYISNSSRTVEYHWYGWHRALDDLRVCGAGPLATGGRLRMSCHRGPACGTEQAHTTGASGPQAARGADPPRKSPVSACAFSLDRDG